MSRMQKKKKWYHKPLYRYGIAAAVAVLVLVLIFALRDSGGEEPKPDEPPQEQVDPNGKEQPKEEQPKEEQSAQQDPPRSEESDSIGYFGPEEVDGQWNLVLVNPWNPLPENFSVELEELDNTRGVDKRCYPMLQKMMDDCRAQGYSPYICSSYRTWEMQQENFDRQVEAFDGDRERAAREVAVPGTSEHQLGLAVDIIDTDNWNLDESQESMPTQQWLMANSWRYGFILRYPNGTTSITGIIYEPWHYRYVGCQAAKEIYESGVTLEEYLGRAEH